jgi:hypothetical protein
LTKSLSKKEKKSVPRNHDTIPAQDLFQKNFSSISGCSNSGFSSYRARSQSKGKPSNQNEEKINKRPSLLSQGDIIEKPDFTERTKIFIIGERKY